MKKFAVVSVLAIVVASLAAFYVTAPAHAVDVLNGCPDTVCSKRTLIGSGDSVFANIMKVVTFLLGAVAVIMLIIGGFRYVTSNGDQSQITSAKNTILYAIVGLILALMAGAIVGFVVNNLG